MYNIPNQSDTFSADDMEDVREITNNKIIKYYEKPNEKESY